MIPSLRLKGNISTGINVVSLFLKAPPVHHSNSSLALLFRVMVVVVLFMIFASIWRFIIFLFHLDRDILYFAGMI